MDTPKTDDWRILLRGVVPPWRGALVLLANDAVPPEHWPRFTVGLEPEPGWKTVWGVRAAGGSQGLAKSVLVPDLEDDDTRRNFDARLALRLGAPAPMVKAGVTLAWWAERQSVVMSAGGPRFPVIWMVDFTPIEDDPGDLILRARAWRSTLTPTPAAE